MKIQKKVEKTHCIQGRLKTNWKSSVIGLERTSFALPDHRHWQIIKDPARKQQQQLNANWSNILRVSIHKPDRKKHRQNIHQLSTKSTRSPEKQRVTLTCSHGSHSRFGPWRAWQPSLRASLSGKQSYIVYLLSFWTAHRRRNLDHHHAVSHEQQKTLSYPQNELTNAGCCSFVWWHIHSP